jgi:proteic killer suppression protein
MSGAQQLFDLSRQIRADARQSVELLDSVHLRQLARQASHQLGRAPIGPDPKRVICPDTQQVRHLLERGRNLLIVKLRLQLSALNVASKPQDMGVPGWRLHQLKGSEVGAWSVTVNGNWRVTFRFEGMNAVLVDYRDYH